jgi:hypothetical protein
MVGDRDVISAMDKRLRGIEMSASSTERKEVHQAAEPASDATGETSQTSSSYLSSLEPSLPWRMLASDTSTPSVVSSQVTSLVEEELTIISASHHLSYDILKKFPKLSKDDVILLARAFAFESPFAFTYWLSVRDNLNTLLERKSAESASHLACMLMVCAFHKPFSPVLD